MYIVILEMTHPTNIFSESRISGLSLKTGVSLLYNMSARKLCIQPTHSTRDDVIAIYILASS